MLDHKALDYQRVDLIPAVHKLLLPLLGFGGTTVPAASIGGRKIVTTRAIARALEELRPDPALFPSDPEARRAVEEVEAWCDEVLQPIPRRLAWWILRRDGSAARSFMNDAHIGLPTPVAMASLPLVAVIVSRYNGATDDAVRADVKALPAHLDRIDSWIAAGVIGTDLPNAADFQIGATIRLLTAFADLASMMTDRPCAALARRLQPQASGDFPALLPPDWV